MAELRLPPKLVLKKESADAPTPASPAPASSAATIPAPAAVIPQAAPAPTTLQPKPVIAAPKLTPRPATGVAAPIATAAPAKPAAMPMPGTTKPATTTPGAVPTGIKKPMPVGGIKPVTLGAKPMPVAAAARPMSVATLAGAAPTTPPLSPVLAPGSSKAKTSRVELGSARAESDLSDDQDLDSASRDSKKPDSKRMTAKISLDSALMPTEAEPDTSTKTIRIKRPGESTSPIKSSPIKAKALESAADNADEAPASDTAGGSKPSLRMKRPETPGTKGKAPAMDIQLEDLNHADSTHWAFVLCGVAALIAAITNLYIVLAGVMDLPWIGRLS